MSEPTITAAARPSLYDAIGGRPAVAAAVDALYARLLADPVTARFFSGMDLARLNGHLRLFLSTALRGAPNRTGRDLSAAHAHLGITDDDFDRVAGHLVAVLAGLGVADEVAGPVVGLVASLRDSIVARGD